MKRFSQIIMLASVVAAGTGCNKFLEEKNPSNFTQDQFFTSAEQATAAVNELYADMRFITDGAGTYGESPFLLLEYPTGLSESPEAAQSIYNGTLRTLTSDNDNNYFYSWWRGCYKAIANANLSIKRIPGVPMDSVARKQLVGQAYFFRALNYFYLVRIFGAVPYQVEPITGPNDPNLTLGRSSVDSIYSLIVSDLTAAEASGLPNTDNTGRTSLGAVKSLLSSVYLTMAGNPLNKGAEYYKKAADKAAEVINGNWYTLFASYDQLHNQADKNKGEFILQSNYSVAANINSTLCAYMIPRGKGTSNFSDEYGLLRPTSAYFKSYEAGDKRTQERQFYYTKAPLYKDPSQTVEFGAPYLYKYYDAVAATSSTPQSDINWTIMRYAELLLIYAEAANEANGGPTQAAYDAVNQVRRRAGLADLAGLSQQDFKEAVWREKYHELSFENKIWFDMVRTLKVYNTDKGTFENFEGFTFTYGPVLTKKYELFGIPRREIDNNKNLQGHQNEGW
ncbi:RagB/SusD family nutrient uptake outer membrane protein [Deminuibacter soli]|uniref:RagB/SusD family nutrient uptake outer membrane protein n=1 Tax=Deminuibacter soli TaxID=2291815 RepID=A0A3E1NNE9_9BACT|nr:RagB/SusD family nutrient uptake outer membrane protein [Deminuibacter soli]RFM29465.1 RagB/SusD family nutrient uptake outer membrane protein [Deminuibacter soli]